MRLADPAVNLAWGRHVLRPLRIFSNRVVLSRR
jgi:hypothetical protein